MILKVLIKQLCELKIYTFEKKKKKKHISASIPIPIQGKKPSEDYIYTASYIREELNNMNTS